MTQQLSLQFSRVRKRLYVDLLRRLTAVSYPRLSYTARFDNERLYAGHQCLAAAAVRRWPKTAMIYDTYVLVYARHIMHARRTRYDSLKKRRRNARTPQTASILAYDTYDKIITTESVKKVSCWMCLGFQVSLISLVRCIIIANEHHIISTNNQNTKTKTKTFM